MLAALHIAKKLLQVFFRVKYFARLGFPSRVIVPHIHLYVYSCKWIELSGKLPNEQPWSMKSEIFFLDQGASAHLSSGLSSSGHFPAEGARLFPWITQVLPWSERPAKVTLTATVSSMAHLSVQVRWDHHHFPVTYWRLACKNADVGFWTGVQIWEARPLGRHNRAQLHRPAKIGAGSHKLGLWPHE